MSMFSYIFHVWCQKSWNFSLTSEEFWTMWSMEEFGISDPSSVFMKIDSFNLPRPVSWSGGPGALHPDVGQVVVAHSHKTVETTCQFDVVFMGSKVYICRSAGRHEKQSERARKLGQVRAYTCIWPPLLTFQFTVTRISMSNTWTCCTFYKGLTIGSTRSDTWEPSVGQNAVGLRWPVLFIMLLFLSHAGVTSLW